MIHISLEAIATDGTARVALSGELDISGVGEVDRHLAAAELENPPIILLDLRALSFIDSTGLRLVLGADERARRAGRRLVVVRGPESVDRVFRVALLDRRLDIVDHDDDDVLQGEEEFAGS